jgi:hypothetical protein
VSGFERQVDQPAVGTFDSDLHIGRVGVLGQAPDQRRDPVGGVLDREGGKLAAGVVSTHAAWVSAAQSRPT